MEAILETFRPVRGYEGLYEISDCGAVRSLNYNKTGKKVVISLKKSKQGYMYTTLSNSGIHKCFRVHRLVYEAFNGPIPEGMQIDHINGVKDDNRLVNLRCVTPKENCNNPITIGFLCGSLIKRSENEAWRKNQRNGIRKTSGKTVIQLNKATGEVIREWECIIDAERELGIHGGDISRCCRGKGKTAGGFKWAYKENTTR